MIVTNIHITSKKMATIRNVPTECLLTNIIDRNFQAMMFPLNIFQVFFLITKFNITNNFITPKNNISNYFTSAAGTIILVLSFIFRFFYYYNVVQKFSSPFVNALMYFDVVFYCIVSVAIHVVSAYYSSSTVELIIKLQTVLNSIKIDKKSFLLKSRIQNWISILSLVSVYAVYFFVPNYLGYSGPVYFLINFIINFVLVVPPLIFDLQLLIVTRTVVLIKNELVAWNTVMETYKKGQIKTKDEVKSENPTENDMFKAYVDIIGAFQLCNKVYKFTFILIGFETFIHILVHLQLVLEFEKSAGDAGFFQSTVMMLLTGAWNLKNFCLLTLLSIACGNFHKTIRIAEATCAQILSNYHVHRGMRRTCKNVFRLRRAALRKLSACGVFELDATLPLRLLAALLAYTVVLLQFAFL